MQDSFAPLRYRDEDRALLSVEDLSTHARVSRAFIRLCIDLGCSTEGGRLSQAVLLEWLFANYGMLRTRAGLVPMASLEGLTGEILMKLSMGNALLTLLEFSSLRSSNVEEKLRIDKVRNMVAMALDRS